MLLNGTPEVEHILGPLVKTLVKTMKAKKYQYLSHAGITAIIFHCGIMLQTLKNSLERLVLR